MKLYGIPEVIAGGTCSFPSIENACNAVINVIQYGIPVARIELLDEVQVRACNQYSGLDLPETPLLLLEFHGSDASVNEQAEMFTIAEEYTDFPFKWTSDEAARKKLWKARHDAYYASLAYAPGKVGVSTDVCVPISRLAECMEKTCPDITECIISSIVGHVGDGNFHCMPMCDPKIRKCARLLTGLSAVYQKGDCVGGTCTGEHGIGQGKQNYIRKEHGDAVDVMMMIKSTIDPKGIMNRAKFSRKINIL